MSVQSLYDDGSFLPQLVAPIKKTCPPSHINNLIKCDQPNCLVSTNKRYLLILSDSDMVYFTCSIFKKKENKGKKTNVLFMYFKYIFVYGTHMCYTLFNTLVLET